MKTHLIHSIRILKVKVFYDTRHLSLQLQLVPVLEVQTGCINHGQQDAVEARLAYLDAGSVDVFRPLGAVPEETVHRGPLFGCRTGRDIRRVNEKTKERALEVIKRIKRG